MDPYDSDSSDRGSEFPSQSIILESPPFNDPNYETYKHGQQFMIVDRTTNQCGGSEVSKIWSTAESAVGSTMAHWIDIRSVTTAKIRGS
jgi:hypothetical protein